MANRKIAGLEKLDQIIKERQAAARDGNGAGDGTVDASFAAEAELTRDLLDTRVYEGTTSWSDTSR
eukprot:14023504-Heterocapsa_arctica.AAC.1